MSEVLKLAIQKSGRLSEDSLKLIKECGINIMKGAALKSSSSNFPIEILLLRDDDIPGYVEDGVADIGIVGGNVHLEEAKDVEEILPLGFSKCRLSIGIPKGMDYKGIQDLNGKKIATSYPKILGSFLKENNVEAHLQEISGSVEIAPSIGLADAVCDIVSSGSTLISNGLFEADVVYKSEAILIGHKGISAEKQAILNKLIFRIKSVLKAKDKKYITLNAPNHAVEAIIKVLPGVKSPSVTSLAEPGWSAIHSVVNENDFWEIVDKLQELGAEGVIVLPIEKIVH